MFHNAISADDGHRGSVDPFSFDVSIPRDSA